MKRVEKLLQAIQPHIEGKTVLETVMEECRRVAKRSGQIFVISSFKMDQWVIKEKLLPHLEEKKIAWTERADKVFTIIGVGAEP